MSTKLNPADKLLNPEFIADVISRKEKQNRIVAILEEEVEDYMKAMNRIFSSPDGQLLLKKMIRYSGLLSFDNKLDASMIEQKGKQKVVTELIIPYIRKELFAQALTE